MDQKSTRTATRDTKREDEDHAEQLQQEVRQLGLTEEQRQPEHERPHEHREREPVHQLGDAVEDGVEADGLDLQQEPALGRAARDLADRLGQLGEQARCLSNAAVNRRATVMGERRSSTMRRANGAAVRTRLNVGSSRSPTPSSVMNVASASA